jgi:hypothetical protein
MEKQMSAQTYGIIANGKVLKNVTVTSFVDYEDHAAKIIAEQRSKKTLDVMPFNRKGLHERITKDGGTDVRLFPMDE